MLTFDTNQIITNSPCKSCGGCSVCDRCSHCGNCKNCGKPIQTIQFIPRQFTIYPLGYPTFPSQYTFGSGLITTSGG